MVSASLGRLAPGFSWVTLPAGDRAAVHISGACAPRISRTDSFVVLSRTVLLNTEHKRSICEKGMELLRPLLPHLRQRGVAGNLDGGRRWIRPLGWRVEGIFRGHGKRRAAGGIDPLRRMQGREYRGHESSGGEERIVAREWTVMRIMNLANWPPEGAGPVNDGDCVPLYEKKRLRITFVRG